MAIKNIIFDLGGVWLPIDERKTLAAFAALTGSPAAEAAPGEKPSASLEKPSNPVAVSEGSDRGLTGAGQMQGETAWSPRTGAGPAQDKSTANADRTAGSQTAVQNIAARLQPDVLAYELGEIDDRTLLGRLGRALRAPDTPPASDRALTDAWNAMLLPFPKNHLPLLEALGVGYRIFLLSNTNALHIRCVEQDFQRRFPGHKPFLQHFEKAYLSHELHLRKPQPEIYTHVLNDAGLRPDETLFVDDRAENIAAAAALGLHTYLHPANTPLTDLPL